MPDPVSSSRAQTTLDPALHYSEASGTCVNPPTAPLSAFPPVSAPESGGHHDAIRSLIAGEVKKQVAEQSNCTFPLGKAVGSCALAVLGGAKGPGLVALATAAISGAVCGVQVMEAYECVTRKP